ncbi:hypothetical protein PMAYCL1PPCAC_27956, partial [Pristionchus mayeri]
KATSTDNIVLHQAEFKPLDYVMKARSYSLPEKFVKYEPNNAEQMDNRVEYEMDEEDLSWLEEENKRRELKKMKKIEEEEFELVVDRLEKKSYLKNPPLTAEESDDKHGGCCICGKAEFRDANVILYCGLCQIGVHQVCYGAHHVSEANWLCRKCKLAPEEVVRCELCPLRGGALKPTTEGKWADVSCAVWLPEVHIDNAIPFKAIEGVDEALRSSEQLRCSVCK